MNNLFKSFIILSLLVFSCDTSTEVSPPQLIISTENVMDNSICELGGVRLELGADLNGNDILEVNEIDSYSIFCNEEIDDTIQISLYPEAEIPECTDNKGGYRVDIGYFWGDNKINYEEFTASFYICGNIDVKNYIIHPTQLLSGGLCGRGYEIKMGQDIDLNKILDENEVEYRTSFYNEQANQDNTIKYTLQDSDYEAIAQAYSSTNPAGAQSMLLYKNFDIMNLWSDEEVSEAISGRLMEIGSKVNCQRYFVTCEVYPPGQLAFAYIYDEDLASFLSIN